jgi:hypothetical protein
VGEAGDPAAAEPVPSATSDLDRFGERAPGEVNAKAAPTEPDRAGETPNAEPDPDPDPDPADAAAALLALAARLDSAEDTVLGEAADTDELDRESGCDCESCSGSMRWTALPGSTCTSRQP